MSNQTEDQWVEVSARLPSRDEEVLCFFPGGDSRYDVCLLTDTNLWIRPNNGFDEADCEPTHWMPLPLMPKVLE